MNIKRTARLTLDELKLKTPQSTVYALGTIAVEAVSRGLGWFDFRTKRDHSTWKISSTTKTVLTEELEQLWSPAAVGDDANPLAVAAAGGASTRLSR
jgi:hypothetical protein